MERSDPRGADGQEHVEWSADKRPKKHGQHKCSISQKVGIADLEPSQVMVSSSGKLRRRKCPRERRWVSEKQECWYVAHVVLQPELG